MNQKNEQIGNPEPTDGSPQTVLHRPDADIYMQSFLDPQPEFQGAQLRHLDKHQPWWMILQDDGHPMGFTTITKLPQESEAAIKEQWYCLVFSDPAIAHRFRDAMIASGLLTVYNAGTVMQTSVRWLKRELSRKTWTAIDLPPEDIPTWDATGKNAKITIDHKHRLVTVVIPKEKAA